jgi:hypothetical protein
MISRDYDAIEHRIKHAVPGQELGFLGVIAAYHDARLPGMNLSCGNHPKIGV